MTDKEEKAGKINWAKAIRLLCEYFENEPSEQALLTEYKICHKEKHSQSTTYWVILGIFLPFITAISAQFIKNVLEKPELLTNDSNVRWVILGSSILALLIILLLFLLLRRTNFFIQIANKRMRDIEMIYNREKHAPIMVLNRIIHYLDKPESKWPQSLKAVLKEYQDCLAKKSKTRFTGKTIAYWLFILVSIPWVFLAVVSAFKCVKALILG